MDINPSRSRFFEGDIIAYWAMKRFVGRREVAITKLKGQQAWHDIFKAAYEMPYSELEKCKMVFYFRTQQLVLLKGLFAGGGEMTP